MKERGGLPRDAEREGLGGGELEGSMVAVVIVAQSDTFNSLQSSRVRLDVDVQVLKKSE